MTSPDCGLGDDCPYYEADHKHEVGNADERAMGGGIAYLPHSCDEWVIGGREEVQSLIDDLLAVLDKAK